jgi:hypothetical protein
VAGEILKLRDLPTTVEGIEDERNDRLSLREERVQTSPQTDELERSLGRTRQELLTRANLVHSETTLPVLPYTHFKMEDPDPLVIAPQQSKQIDIDIENTYAGTPIYEHTRKSSSVPIQHVIHDDRQYVRDGRSVKPPQLYDQRNGTTERSASNGQRRPVTNERRRPPSKDPRKSPRRAEGQYPNDDESSSSSSFDQSYDYRSKRNSKSHSETKRPSVTHATASSTATQEAPLVQGSFYKLNADLLGTWDPAMQHTYAFTANIMQARLIYGDMTVVAAIPTALTGQAKKWFRSLHEELFDPKMNTAKGWVELLEHAFPVDQVRTRWKAKSRHYVPTKDDSVMEYVWDKVELFRPAKRDISEGDLIEEIWLGLLDEIRLSF